jgi:hypothetical protein
VTTLLDAIADALLGSHHAPATEPPTMSNDIDFTSPEALSDLEAFLCRRFKARVVVKGDSAVMRVIAETFGVAAMLGANVPSSEEFLTGFATTLGPVVFLPGGVTDPKRRIGLVLHEAGHVQAFWHEPLFMPRAYLQSGEKRATYEAAAERGRFEGMHQLYGELPTADRVNTFLAHGYACAAPDVTLAQQLLDEAGTAAASGVLSSPVGLAVAEWKRARETGAVLT